MEPRLTGTNHSARACVLLPSQVPDPPSADHVVRARSIWGPIGVLWWLRRLGLAWMERICVLLRFAMLDMCVLYGYSTYWNDATTECSICWRAQVIQVKCICYSNNVTADHGIFSGFLIPYCGRHTIIMPQNQGEGGRGVPFNDSHILYHDIIYNPVYQHHLYYILLLLLINRSSLSSTFAEAFCPRCPRFHCCIHWLPLYI